MKWIKNEKRTRLGNFNLEMLMVLAAHDNSVETLDFKKLATVLKHKDKGGSKYDTSKKKKSNALKRGKQNKNDVDEKEEQNDDP